MSGFSVERGPIDVPMAEDDVLPLREAAIAMLIGVRAKWAGFAFTGACEINGHDAPCLGENP